MMNGKRKTLLDVQKLPDLFMKVQSLARLDRDQKADYRFHHANFRLLWVLSD